MSLNNAANIIAPLGVKMEDCVSVCSLSGITFLKWCLQPTIVTHTARFVVRVAIKQGVDRVVYLENDAIN